MKELLVLQEPGISAEETGRAAERLLPGWTIIPGQEPHGHSALITVRHPVNREMLKGLTGGIVSVAFTGYDHIDMDSAREFGIAVSNVPGYSTASVAELAFSLAVMSMRDPRRGLGTELRGKTVGIIGTGNIGMETAGLFKAAGCSILGWSRSMREGFPGKYVTLEKLLEESEVVSLHIPLNRESEMFMDRGKLKMMKKGAVLVNTARGALVDQEALQEMLQSGWLGGAGLDVTSPEPLPDDHPLFSIPGVIITPHTGYRTAEAIRRRAREALLNIAFWERGERRNRVD